MVRAQRGLTWRLAASSAEKALRSPWGRCHQQRWIGAAGHRRWARTVMAASPSTTTRAGAATSCSWAPIIDQSSPTVRPSRWVWARRRPTGPERPVSPIARFTGTPLVLSPARPPVPSSMTTFGDRCPGPSTGTPTTRHSSRSPAPDLAVNDWPATDPPPPAVADADAADEPGDGGLVVLGLVVLGPVGVGLVGLVGLVGDGLVVVGLGLV